MQNEQAKMNRGTHAPTNRFKKSLTRYESEEYGVVHIMLVMCLTANRRIATKPRYGLESGYCLRNPSSNVQIQHDLFASAVWYTLTSDVCAKVSPSSPLARILWSMGVQMLLAIHHRRDTRVPKRRKGYLWPSTIRTRLQDPKAEKSSTCKGLSWPTK